MTALGALLDRLPPLTLVVGKGGVGKTTIAAGLAAHLSARRSPGRTLLLSTDPARTLGEAISQVLTPVPRPLAGYDRLDVQQLSAQDARTAFLARWRDTIVAIVDRGTYLDMDDITGLVDAALPGADEIFALLELARLTAGGSYTRIVVDTAPTGHTLRLLALPDTFRALVALLDAMQDKHRFMVGALTHRYRRDQADAFLSEMRVTIDALSAALTDPARGGALLVARAEPVVVAESSRYASALAAARIHVAALIVNALGRTPSGDERRALEALDGVAAGVPHYVLPRTAEPPAGIAAIAVLVERLTERRRPARIHGERPSRQESRQHRAPARGEAAARFPWPASLLIVGGKGGVGKTTASCALAIVAAGEGRNVLLVSTDPAPSIADALAQPVSDAEHEVAGTPGLVARQMDAGAAFARFRAEYQARIDALFETLLSRGLDAAHDRAIVRDLLALAPPGIDELYALASLGDTIHEGRFDRIVVDPAPTGHLLRLLEMPPQALDWSHRLMRLMLKYKDVAGLGDSAQALLDFAKRTRELDALLHDRARAGLAVVALDEPLVRGETSRLVDRLRALDVNVVGVLWNRVHSPPTPLPTHPPVRQFVAPATQPAPIGVADLRTWSAQWVELTTRDG